MGAGKVLVIIGAIITLVSTFFFSLFYLDMPAALLWMEAGDNYGNGLNFFMHIIDLFTDAENVAAGFATEVYLVYIITILLIFFAISGVIQLIGLKSRAAAIIGSLMPLFIGVLIILGTFIDLPDILGGFLSFQLDGELVEGIIPFHFALADISIGAILLTAGGALALIGGIIGVSEF